MWEFPNDYYRGGSEILALLCQDHSRFAVCRVFRHWIYRAAVTAQASPQWNIWAWQDKIDTALSLSADSARQIQPVFRPLCNCAFKPHTLAASTCAPDNAAREGARQQSRTQQGTRACARAMEHTAAHNA